MLRRTISEQRLLKREIPRGATVACIGSYGSPRRDASPLFLAHEKACRVFIVDARLASRENPRDGARLTKARKVHEKRRVKPPEKLVNAIQAAMHVETKPGIGVGGLKEYLEEVRGLERAGAIKPVKIRPRMALAWNTGFKPGSVNCIVDRGTFSHVFFQGHHVETIEHYLKVVPPGGKVVLIAKAPYAKWLRNLLEKTVGDRAKLREQAITPTEKKPYKIGGRKYACERDYGHAIIVTKQ